MFKRSEKVAEAIHEEISKLLVKGVKDPRVGFVTVTGVKVTDDLHLATVYFSVIGTDADRKGAEAGLNSARVFCGVRSEKFSGCAMCLTYFSNMTNRLCTEAISRAF
jgi:ribosome-binding factor A